MSLAPPAIPVARPASIATVVLSAATLKFAASEITASDNLTVIASFFVLSVVKVFACASLTVPSNVAVILPFIADVVRRLVTNVLISVIVGLEVAALTLRSTPAPRFTSPACSSVSTAEMSEYAPLKVSTLEASTVRLVTEFRASRSAAVADVSSNAIVSLSVAEAPCATRPDVASRSVVTSLSETVASTIPDVAALISPISAAVPASVALNSTPALSVVWPSRTIAKMSSTLPVTLATVLKSLVPVVSSTIALSFSAPASATLSVIATA